MRGNLSLRRRMLGDAETASCLQVGRDLQAYLDGQVDDLTAARLARHLELCRRCGMKAETYRLVKDSLARRGHDVDPAAVERLRAFGEELLDRREEPPYDDEAPSSA